MKFSSLSVLFALSLTTLGSSSTATVVLPSAQSTADREPDRELPDKDPPACQGACDCGDANFLDVKGTFTLGQAACGKAEFSSLCAALTAADLLEAVSDPSSSLTVFAPSNDAFDALGSETLAFLFSPDGKELLQNILLLHVVAPELKQDDLMCGKKVETLLEGQKTRTVCKSVGTAFQVGGGNVRGAFPEYGGEAVMCNGVFQVISQVMLPGDSPKPSKSTKKNKKNANR